MIGSIIGAEPVILYGLDINGVPVPLKLNADGTLSAASGLELGSTPSTQAIGDAAAGGASIKAAPELHKHGMPSFASPGAFAYALAIGSAATLPHSDHVHGLALSTVSAVPSGTVSSGANTWGDLCSVSCVAGTWLLVAFSCASGGTNGTVFLKLYDSTTPSPNTPVAFAASKPSSGGNVELSLVAIVTPAQTTAYTLAGAADVISVTFSKTNGPVGSASGPATVLIGLRLA